jgi:type IV pilus assembly protein PilV
MKLTKLKSHSYGVSLIEVLISVLILSIGLLGIAAMQATALRNSQSSVERSQAVIATYSILDSIRANPDIISNTASVTDYNMARTCASAPPASAGTLISNDRRDWVIALGNGLGSTACGQIACVAADRSCTITVDWNDARGTKGADLQAIATQSIIL